MFIVIRYFFYLIFVVFLSACSGVDTEGIRNNLSGGSSSLSQDAASFSQTLELVSTDELQNWLNTSFKAARDTRLHLNLQYSGYRSPEGSATYKGSFSISYTEDFNNGNIETNEFVMETGEGQADTQYNYVYLDQDGQFTWKAFFQDQQGSLLVILTQGQKADECSANDGCDNEVFFSMANGAVYYRNWPPEIGQAPLPPTKCWLLKTGPYDCRTWKSGTGMDLLSAVEPDGTAARFDKRGTYPYTRYTKLATFKDLDFKILFAIDPDLTSSTLKPSSHLVAINKGEKVLRGVASVVKTKTSRDLSSSIKAQKEKTVLSKVLLITLSLIFIGLLLLVFFRRKEEL